MGQDESWKAAGASHSFLLRLSSHGNRERNKERGPARARARSKRAGLTIKRDNAPSGARLLDPNDLSPLDDDEPPW